MNLYESIKGNLTESKINEDSSSTLSLVHAALDNLQEIVKVIEEEGSIDQDVMLSDVTNAIDILNRLALIIKQLKETAEDSDDYRPKLSEDQYQIFLTIARHEGHDKGFEPNAIDTFVRNVNRTYDVTDEQLEELKAAFEEGKNDGDIEELSEADTGDVNYNVIVNDVIKTYLPYVDEFKFKEMQFSYKFKDFDKESLDMIQDKFKEDREALINELNSEGLELTTSAMGDIIIKAR